MLSSFQVFKNFKLSFPNNTNNTITPVTVPTISHTIDSAIQHHVISSNSSDHNVTFTTGLITSILATLGAGLVIKVTNIYGLPFYTSALLQCYGLINTTLNYIYLIDYLTIIDLNKTNILLMITLAAAGRT